KSTTVKNEKDHTLYAQWAAKSYKIKYNVNGGKALKTKSKTVKYGSKYGELAKPVRAGYTFKGWYTKASGGTKIKDTSVVKITKTTTLYAHWEEK
ncbi:MAG: InlB B-repeat-containing protein, partial [Clostridiales Family XIII bacterium]|nr:InlB B-repeat-containing protein [Clostridiales Family XIII bacterium]